MDLDNRGRHHSWIRGPVIPVDATILMACIVAYGVNRFALKGMFGWRFLHCYLSDILAGPVILAYTNILLVAVRKEAHSLRTLPRILVFMLVAGVFWEFITPLYRKGSVTDYADIAAYLVGGLAYWIMMKTTKCEPGAPVDADGPPG